MTYSLRLENGDLAKGVRNSLSTVSGAAKVAQDLRSALLEPFGSDPLNPTYGSFIDFPQGAYVDAGDQSYYLPDDLVQLVTSEVNRIINVYRTQQSIRLQAEAQLFGRTTFSEDEIIEDYTIEYEQDVETLYVNVELTFVSGEEINLLFPVTGGGGS